MMEIAFTICSNNYLAYAKVLGKSLKKFQPALKYMIFLCDDRNDLIDYGSLADEVIPVHLIEPQFKELASKYNIIEFNTCIKPRVFEYLFYERGAEKIIFFDPDVEVFNSISFLYDELDECSIILTPHICTPIVFDNKKPDENHFLNFGIYNLGFIGLKKNEDTKMFLSWWKQHTYNKGYIDVYKGIFVDQLPINLATIFFKNVKALNSFALNMAPWNLHERYLSEKDEKYIVNENEKLIFFHFSSFKTDELELPLFQYNRFNLNNRADIQSIYKHYNEELKQADYFFYKKFDYCYNDLRNIYIKKQKKEKWKKRMSLRKIFLKKKQ